MKCISTGEKNVIARGECEVIGECGTTIEACPKCEVGSLVSLEGCRCLPAVWVQDEGGSLLV